MLAFSMIASVSAQYYGSSPFSYLDLGQGVRQIIDQSVNFLAPIFEVVLGDYSGSEFFFTKVLLLILLFAIIYFVLERTPLFEGKRGIVYIIALIISVIAIRFISENQLVNMILLPYGTLGIALTTILPFLIFAYFIHTTDMPGIGRKLSWLFFGIIFFILWVYKADGIGEIGNQIYFWTMLAMVIMLIFDKRIHAYFKGLDVKKFEQEAHDNEIVNLQNQLGQIINSAVGGRLSRDQELRADKIRRRLRKLGARESR